MKITKMYYEAKSLQLVFAAYLTYGAFLMFVLKFSNPFYMTAPALDGTIFTIWVIIPIYLVVYSLIILIVELV